MKRLSGFAAALCLMLLPAGCAAEGPGSAQQSSEPLSSALPESSAASEPASVPSADESGPAPESSAESESENNGALVVYFSWSGNTEQAALEIAAQTGAEIFEIEPADPYTTDYNELLEIASEEQRTGARPAIAGTLPDLDSVDTVFLGYPNWWGDMPMILYSYLDSADLGGKTICPFVTSGGSGFSNTLAVIREMEPEASVTAGLSLGSSQAADCADAAAAWLDEAAPQLKNKNKEENVMTITANGSSFACRLADNPSAEALKALLAEGPLTISMEDYANMEKVGPIGRSLPRSDTPTDTGPGDVILYQGDSLVIYYGHNSWNFTPIGRIADVTEDELLAVLGEGSVEVTFSLDR